MASSRSVLTDLGVWTSSKTYNFQSQNQKAFLENWFYRRQMLKDFLRAEPKHRRMRLS